MKILVIEDERLLADSIRDLLTQKGFEVETVYDGESGAEYAELGIYDLLILDVMMPKLDGIHTIMKIRETSSIPIIVLSAKSQDSDKVLGLNLGADDYITKPFNPMELVARVKSQLRRYTDLGDINTRSDNVIVNGRLMFKLDEHVLYADGEPVKLTATETKIVELLMKHPGRIFPAEEIYSLIWNEPAYSAENTVMVHIRRIREKIELNPSEPEYLKVVWGIGYEIEKH